MTTFASLVLLLLLSPVPGVDVSGVWSLDMHWSGSDSDSTGVCTLKQDDQKLTGSCQSSKSTITGEVNDRKIILEIAVEQDGNKGLMTFTGTLDDDGRKSKGGLELPGGRRVPSS